ncbi:hypothetical protein N7462_006678 [Penicillium macrosclerotiorum]|uniref:uncharacterized protein n=1 Tax=Penicillium macrosclerotiorum TaxID=303699 RepID=UPI00254946DD|nr:uncharacterized protein N7462_006678 [Penicillium macrosclerotiorum]KAJ5683513.1 hypothetical protein N7462_006678 [Penicillium macrosclerotiorum]
MLAAYTAGSLAKLPLAQLPRPDLILLLGARTGMFLGGRGGLIIPEKDCKLVQVDCDGGEIGRSLSVDLGIVSDIKAFVSALKEKLRATDTANIDKSWVRAALSLASMEVPFEKEPEMTDSGLLHPYHAIKSLMTALDPGSIIVLDGGEAGVWAADLASLSQPHTVMKATGYLGFLGNGFGYSLGCAIAAPDRKVINMQGDGSAGFHLLELDTFKRFNLDIMTIVVNNSNWGMSINGQDLIYGSKHQARPVSQLSSATEYDIVAKGLQNGAAKISVMADIHSTVSKLKAQSGPTCLNLIVDRKPTHPVTTMMVGLTDNPDSVVVPYYDNIPRAYYKL